MVLGPILSLNKFLTTVQLLDIKMSLVRAHRDLKIYIRGNPLEMTLEPIFHNFPEFLMGFDLF